MTSEKWLTLSILTLKCQLGNFGDYNMGCDCGLRTIDEDAERACEESALLESSDNVNHLN